MQFGFAAAFVLAVAAMPTVALADPDDLVSRPLVLPAGQFDLHLTAEINVAARQIGRPLSFAPDAWWGASPHWTIGLIHSNASLDQIDSGATLCVVQSDLSTCHDLYRGSGVDVRYDALDGPLAIAPRLRAVIRDIDPFKPALTVGALARWAHGRFAISADPYIRIPLANHDLGNRSALVLPLWLAVQPLAGWLISLQTGYQADFAVFTDGGHGPLALSVIHRATPELDLGIEAGWAVLLGPQHDARHGTLMITAAWRP